MVAGCQGSVELRSSLDDRGVLLLVYFRSSWLQISKPRCNCDASITGWTQSSGSAPASATNDHCSKMIRTKQVIFSSTTIRSQCDTIPSKRGRIYKPRSATNTCEKDHDAVENLAGNNPSDHGAADSLFPPISSCFHSLRRGELEWLVQSGGWCLQALTALAFCLCIVCLGLSDNKEWSGCNASVRLGMHTREVRARLNSPSEQR